MDCGRCLSGTSGTSGASGSHVQYGDAARIAICKIKMLFFGPLSMSDGCGEMKREPWLL